MTKPNKRLLVIDASVVCSAGETEHPISSSCRACLETILCICHRVAVTPTIRDEWNRHMSRYSRKWRCSMAAKKKLVQLISPIGIRIDTSGLSDTERAAIDKDRCLLDAALSADHVIVTRDDSLRLVLAKTPQGDDILKQITWVNPESGGVDELKRL